MKGVLLGIVVLVLWSSPQARVTTANVLRSTANWITPKKGEESPKNFVIPNPFYTEKTNVSEKYFLEKLLFS